MRGLLGESEGTIDRDGYTIVWEPRGTWHENHDRVKAVCDDLDLVHVVDPLRDDPVSAHSTAYVRLHGRNEDRYDHAYDYDDSELRELRDVVSGLSEDHETVFVLFNNDEMFANASRIREICRTATE